MNNGAYDLEGVIYHQHSNKLMKKILELWQDKSARVRDLGCGHNFYISVMRYAGFNDAEGWDAVDLGSKYFENVDLSKQWVFHPHKTNVISIEVGEHIPADSAQNYLDNVAHVAAGGDVIMSWAVPGQPGHGHINCQTNDWVKDQMFSRGYQCDEQVTLDLRLAVKACHCSWLRNTLMYFRYITKA